MLTKTSLSTREAQRPMPEDADQDILEALVCLWPTVRSNRAKLTCQGRGVEEAFRAWVGKIQFLFWQSFRWLFSVQLKSFLWASCRQKTRTRKKTPSLLAKLVESLTNDRLVRGSNPFGGLWSDTCDKDSSDRCRGDVFPFGCSGCRRTSVRPPAAADP